MHDLLKMSKLGFGCARMNNMSPKNCSNLIEECIENNILHFDTAPSYGSEKILGDVLKGVKNSTITSKIGLPRIKQNDNLMNKIYKRSLKSLANISPSIKNKISLALNKSARNIKYEKRILSMDEIMFDLEKTLININRSSLDILLIHEPDQFIIDDDLIERFDDLRKQGLIENYGLGYGHSDFKRRNFGHVCQFLFKASELETSSSINIVHGIIRASIIKGNSGSQHKDFIDDFIMKNKNTTVLFSASNVSQITEICSKIY